MSRESICIVQISRIGDIIQTLQACSKFKFHHPEINLVLVCRRKFGYPLDFILRNVFHKIYYLDFKDWFSRDNGGEVTLETVQKKASDFISSISKENISVCMNFSFSKASSYLCGLIKSKHKFGPYRDSKSKLIIEDQWGQFVFSNVMGGGNNPYSLVDIFSRMISSELRISELYPVEIGSSKMILIHPFASRTKKKWPSYKWSEVLYQLLRDFPEYTITIIGGKEDVQQADQILKNSSLVGFSNRIRNLVGKASLEEILNELKNARLFIGHDSMGGHLASLHKVQTVTISLGTVRPIETTPYAINNYNLAPRIHCFPCFPSDACSDFPCHRQVSHQLVIEVISQLLAHGEVCYKRMAEKIAPLHLESINLYRTISDKNGNLNLELITQNTPSINEVFKSYYKILWDFVIRNEETIIPFPQLTEKTTYYLEYYLEGIEKLYETHDFGIKYSQYIYNELKSQSANLENIQGHSQKIAEIDNLCLVLKKSFPLLAPIIDYYMVQRSGLKGRNPLEVVESSYKSYHEACLALSILYELIQKNLEKFPQLSRVKPRQSTHGVSES